MSRNGNEKEKFVRNDLRNEFVQLLWQQHILVFASETIYFCREDREHAVGLIHFGQGTNTTCPDVI